MNDYTSNDLPSEHGQSLVSPSSRRAISTVHIQQKGKNIQFFPSPPLNARTYSFYTQNQPENSRVLGTRITRRGLLVQNVSSNIVYLSVGNQAGADGLGGFSDAIEIPAGAGYEFPAHAAPVNDVYIVSTNGGDAVVIVESFLAGVPE